MPENSTQAFDPAAKEAELRSESQTWDTRNIAEAESGDVPTIDVSDYFETNKDEALDAVARQLNETCLHTGFYSLVGHGFPHEVSAGMFAQAQRLHSLPDDQKRAILMDRPDWPIKGVGYLPVKHRKLPSRDKGNLNEAFVIKRDHVATLNDNQWPEENNLPGFRKATEHYAREIEALAIKLLPVYARALGVDKGFFEAAFTRPLYRLRMTRYPSIAEKDADEYGIAPHVDTTFFTLLAQDSSGLVIYSEKRGRWIRAPVIGNAFIVNTGELLKQWTNDRYVSVKHFANNNTSDADRYSIPFFFNANGDYKMACIPTCCDSDTPPKYPPISYLESQAVVQGE